LHRGFTSVSLPSWSCRYPPSQISRNLPIDTESFCRYLIYEQPAFLRTLGYHASEPPGLFRQSATIVFIRLKPFTKTDLHSTPWRVSCRLRLWGTLWPEILVRALLGYSISMTPPEPKIQALGEKVVTAAWEPTF